MASKNQAPERIAVPDGWDGDIRITDEQNGPIMTGAKLAEDAIEMAEMSVGEWNQLSAEHRVEWMQAALTVAKADEDAKAKADEDAKAKAKTKASTAHVKPVPTFASVREENPTLAGAEFEYVGEGCVMSTAGHLVKGSRFDVAFFGGSDPVSKVAALVDAGRARVVT